MTSKIDIGRYVVSPMGIYCILLAVAVANGQLAEKLTSQNPCVSKTTCHECIQTKSCAWCLQPQAEYGDLPRCFQPSYGVGDSRCPEEYTYNPDNEMIPLLNMELTRRVSGAAAEGGGGAAASGYSASGYSASGSSYSSMSSSSSHYGSSSSSSGSTYGFGAASGGIVQISPQRVKLKLRINEEYHLNMRYSQAEDYPIDLYYLMDLSKSMEDDKHSLSYLGNSLSETMRNITSNFRLGFGSFVDKVLMPYVSTVPKKLEHPCDGCEAPYGFKNHMALSMDTMNFSKEVSEASVSGNLDAPEGGFDAIMQAIACRDEVGWREHARRLLVFSTDAGFHYAGDGKLGGVITPNDGECHLDKNGHYTHSKIQDYPSISQINLKVKQNAINVIFAVTKQQIEVYKKLSEHIEGSSAAELSSNSSNVVQLVEEEYNKISSSVVMKDNATSAVKITYYSSCLEGGKMVQTNKCDGLKVGDMVEFRANILVQTCPQNPRDWFQTFQIYPVGINESLIVDLQMLCDCECEHPDHRGYVSNAAECNYHGTLKCGICECYDQYFGRNCECGMLDIHSEIERDRACRPDNTTIDCSGRGACVCGVCECEKRPNPEEVISGTYCECDNFSCDRHNGLLCSGPDHGVCQCGVCHCLEGWTGTACDCRASNDTCINPHDGEICSGNGECVCGTCNCKITDEGRYSGRYCEKCPTCSGRCHEFKDCVQCQVYQTGPMGDDKDLCMQNCTLFTPITEEVVTADETKDEVLCTFYDEDDCRFQFVYTDRDDDKVVVRAQEERECPPKVFMLGVVLGVIAAIVLIGLAILLLWKLLTTINDRREFARFEKERMMAKWDTGENPIYKQATSTFKNPTYAGK
uniref:Integrin beta n=1 Tax=Lutzomyia longipalpis TaxID=7200 RepID=A0A7G3AQR4_LUTLO